MDAFRNHIAEIAALALDADPEEIRPLLEPPRDPDHGDLAIPCFVLAKKRGKSPVELAKMAAAVVEIESPLEKVEATGPYLNFTLETAVLAETVITRVLDHPDAYGTSEIGEGKTVVIDFSSPNIAKPFGIHHLRSTVIGGAIGRVLAASGYNVVKINHLGDWGTQFGQLIVAFQRWGEEKVLEERGIPYLLELYVRFNGEKESSPELQEEARSAFRALEGDDPECRRLWNLFRKVSEVEFKRLYDRLDIEFDHYTGESFYETRMGAVLDELEQKGLLKESEEATIVDLTDDDLGVCVVKKKDDATLYVTRDLAAAIYRHDTFDFTRSLYVVGAGQSLHFRQLFRILELMGRAFSEDMVHVPFGLLRFKDRKMSTRKGDILLLEDVLDRAEALARDIVRKKNPDLSNADEVARQVGMGAVVFNDLKSRRIKDVTFDWDEVLTFEGDTGPYLQYAFARVASIFRKAGVEDDHSFADADYASMGSRAERDLIHAVAAYPDVVRRAAEEYEPSTISGYLLETAAALNRFYIECRIIGTERGLMEARLALARASQIVLRNGLNILGIQTPVEM